MNTTQLKSPKSGGRSGLILASGVVIWLMAATSNLPSDVFEHQRYPSMAGWSLAALVFFFTLGLSFVFLGGRDVWQSWQNTLVIPPDGQSVIAGGKDYTLADISRVVLIPSREEPYAFVCQFRDGFDVGFNVHDKGYEAAMSWIREHLETSVEVMTLEDFAPYFGKPKWLKRMMKIGWF